MNNPLSFRPIPYGIARGYPRPSPNVILRYEAAEWLLPIRKAFAELRTGEVDTIRGYPVTRVEVSDTDERIDECIAGFRSLMERLAPDISGAALLRVENKLSAGVLLSESDLDQCEETILQFEIRLTTLRRDVVLEASMVEQVDVAMQRLAIK